MSGTVVYGVDVREVVMPDSGILYIVSLFSHDEDGRYLEFTADVFDMADVKFLQDAWRNPEKRKLLYAGSRLISSIK